MDNEFIKPLPKITAESERTIEPSETFKHAKQVFQRLGLDIEFGLCSLGDFFWTASIKTDFSRLIPYGYRSFRVGGKGLSRHQCLASCIMELAERLSMRRYAARRQNEHICVNLRTGNSLTIRTVDMNNSMCVSAGNNIPEAVLHSLHELIETRTQHSCYWKPFQIVPLRTLMPELPEWVLRTAAVVKTPTDIPEFHHFTALRYHRGQEFDERTSERFELHNNRIYTVKPLVPLDYHSPNSGSAASLNPKVAVIRAINESFQGKDKDINSQPTLPAYSGMNSVGQDEFLNYETDTINGDILKILNLLPPNVFVGYIDITDPMLEIPVIKLISDYDPRASLASRAVLSRLFEL